MTKISEKGIEIVFLFLLVQLRERYSYTAQALSQLAIFAGGK